jgi:hypothetical protein
MTYPSLRDVPTAYLLEINRSAEKLLSYKGLLSSELGVKLDTLHADIAAILEDREDLSGESAGLQVD